MVKPDKSALTTTCLAGLILASGIFLRFYHLAGQPYWMDEGFTVNAVLAVIQRGQTVLDSGQSYYCPLYCYPTAALTHLLGQSALAYRILAAAAGSAFVIVFYFTVKKLYDNKIAVLSTLFVSLSYYQIAWSRQARWYTLLVLFVWLALYNFFQLAENGYRDRRRLILTIFFTILSVLVQPTALLLIPIFTIWIIFTPVVQGKTKGRLLISTLLFASIFLAVLEFFGTKMFGGDSLSGLIESVSFHYNLPYYLGFYFRTYWLLIFFTVFALITVKNRFLRLLLLAFAVYLLAFSLLTNIVQYRYLFPLTPFFCLGGASGIFVIFGKLRHQHIKLALGVAVTGILLITHQEIIWPQHFYFLESDQPTHLHLPYYANTPQPDFNAAYAVIKAQRQPEEIIISSQPQFTKIFLGEPGYWISYDYLGRNPGSDVAADSSKEFYADAEVIGNAESLKKITTEKHGYILLDSMAIERIDPDILEQVWSGTKLVFHSSVNIFSQVSVYSF